MRKGWVLIGLAAWLASGCRLLGGSAESTAVGAAGGAAVPGVKVYSDPLPVTSIAFAAPTLWAGNARGLVRWNVNTEEVQRIGPEQGLPGSSVRALALDGAGGVWVVTEAGVGRVAEGKYVNMPPLPAAALAILAPLPGGEGTWAAGPGGLYRTDGKAWVSTLSGVGVTSLELAPDSSIWAGTAGRGVVHVAPDGAIVRAYGPSENIDLADVAGTTTFDTGVRVVAGRGKDGSRLLLIETSGAHDLLRALPDFPLQRVAKVGSEVVVLGGAGPAPKLYKLRQSQRGEPAPEGGFRFVPERKGPDAPRYAVVPLTLSAPPGTTVVATSHDSIWFGTETLGVARADPKAPTYFRSGEITAGAERVTVVCPRAFADGGCLIATGGARVWRFDGKTFVPAQVGQPAGVRVDALLADHAENIYAVFREADFKGFTVTKLEGQEWKPHRRVAVQVPEGPPLFAWAKMSPIGNLWIGVHYKEKNGEDHSFGVVEEDFVRQRTLHHRRYAEGESAPPGSLPLSNTVSNLTFDGATMWFTSLGGVIRWQESEVKVWGENEGLESETCLDIEAGPRGEMWVATSGGVGRFDGRVWRFDDGPTKTRARALVRDLPRDRMWVATQHGLVMVGAQGPVLLDSSNQLVEDDVRDVTIDGKGRIWALGKATLVVVE